MRPLSIVNADNHLIANALRHVMQKRLSSSISEVQQGFFPGRSVELHCCPFAFLPGSAQKRQFSVPMLETSDVDAKPFFHI